MITRPLTTIVVYVAAEIFNSLNTMDDDILQQHKQAIQSISNALIYMYKNGITKCKGKGASLYSFGAEYPYSFTLTGLYVNGRWETAS